MSSSAQVLSIDQLVRLKEALTRLINEGQTALGLAEMSIRRVVENLEERLRFWHQQVIRCREEMAQARASLSHARALHDGKSVGCAEQEIELRRVQERVRHAEEKVALVKRWQRDLPGYLKEYEAPARSLSGFLETDLRQAVVLLDNKIAALHGYLTVAAPEPTTTEPS